MKPLTYALLGILGFVLAAPPAFAGVDASGEKAIELNTATRAELIALPGIGEAKADAIIAHRRAKPFSRAEELLLVKGIGDGLYARLKPMVTVKPPATGVPKRP